MAEKFDTYFTVEVNGKLKMILQFRSQYFKFCSSIFSIFSSNQVASSNILSEPIITTKSREFGIENGQIELYCSVDVASMMDRLEMKWELPNENIAKQVLIHTKIVQISWIKSCL